VLMKTSQSFPFYPTDFLMGTMFLSTEEVGAYIRLLCYQWQEGKIPENSENLKKISGISRKKLENVLKKFQRYEENSEFFLVNDRLEVVRGEREQFIEIQRANGKKGGRPPKQKPEGLENPRVSQDITQTKPELTLPSPSPSPSPLIPPNPQGGGDDEKEKSQYPKAFEQFWEAYPKKKAKGAALIAWKKAKDKPEIENLIEIIEENKESKEWKKENGQFIPYPATWINEKRWLDELFVQAEISDFAHTSF